MKLKKIQDQRLQLKLKLGVILGENFSKWGEGRSK